MASPGDIAVIEGSGQALPGTTAAVLDLGTVTSDAGNIVTEISAGRYRPDVAGYYSFASRGRFQLTHNNRLQIFWEFYKNGTVVEGSAHSGYGRNSSNDEFTPEAFAIEYFNGTTDYFEVFDERDTGAGTPAGTYQDTRGELIYWGDLSDGVEYIRVAFGTQSSMAASQATPVQQTISSTVVASTDSSVLDVSGNGIRLRETGRPYLAVGGFGDTAGPSARSGFIGHLQHNSVALLHSYTDVYNRDASNNKSYVSTMGLVRPGTADQSLTMWRQGVERDGLTAWGSVDSNSYVMDSGGMMVLALPSSTEIGIYEGDGINQSWSGTAVLDLNFMNDTAVAEDTASFNKQNASTVRVANAENTFTYAGGLTYRTASSGTRNNNAIRVEIGGVDQTDSMKMTYVRGDQSSDDHFNGAPRTFWTWAASANDDVQFEKFQQGGQNSGANDSLRWGGAFFINLATLTTSGTAYDESGRSASFDALCAAADTVAFDEQGLSALVEFTTSVSDSVSFSEAAVGLFASVDLTVDSTDVAGFLDAAAAALADFSTDSTDTADFDESGLSAEASLTADSTDTYGSGSGLEILFIHQDSGTRTADTDLETLLEDRGDTVTFRADNLGVPVDVGDYDVIVINETCSGSSNPGGTYRTTAVPVVSLEAYCLDEMDVNDSHSDDTSETTIDVQDATHPIAVEAGLVSGSNTILSTAGTINGSSTTGPDAAEIAETSTAGKVVLGAYDTGDTMIDSYDAPARRVWFTIREAAIVNFNTLGEDVFLACVDWAAGVLGTEYDETGLSASFDPTADSSDTVEFNDQGLSAVADFAPDSTDAVTFVDSLAATADLSTAVTDSQGFVDNLDALVEWTVDSTDVLTSASNYDETGRSASFDLTTGVADQAGFVDNLAATVDATTQATDAVAWLDASAAEVEWTAALSDAQGVAEQGLSALADFTAAGSDDYVMGESLAATVDLSADSSDSADFEDLLSAEVEWTVDSTDTYSGASGGPVEVLEVHDWGTRYTETTTTVEEICSIAGSAFTNGDEYLLLYRMQLYGSSSSQNSFDAKIKHPINSSWANLAYRWEPASSSYGDILSKAVVYTANGTDGAALGINEHSSYVAYGYDASIVAINLTDLGTQNTDWWYSTGGSGTNTTSWQNRETITMTPAAGEDLLIIGSCLNHCNNVDHQAEVEIAKDGTRLPDSTWHSIEGEDTFAWSTCMVFGVDKNVTATSRTYQLRTRDDGGTSGFNYVDGCRIVVIPLDRFENHSTVNGSDETSPLTSTWIQLATVTHTPDTTGDQVVIAGFSHNAYAKARLQFDGTDDPGDPYQMAYGYFDADDRHSHPIFTVRSIDTSGDAIDLDYWTTWSGAAAYEPQIVAFSARTAGGSSGSEYDETGRSASFDITTDSTESVDFADSLDAQVEWATGLDENVGFLETAEGFIGFTVDTTDTLTLHSEGEASWLEFEAPLAPRLGHASWLEFETPDAPRAGWASWLEVQLDDAPRGGENSWLELEVPVAARAGWASWFGVETGDPPRAAHASWMEFETSSLSHEGEASWLELEVPDAQAGECSWVEVQVGEDRSFQLLLLGVG